MICRCGIAMSSRGIELFFIGPLVMTARNLQLLNLEYDPRR